MNVAIREGLPADRDEIERCYRRAFPDEDLAPLAMELMGQPTWGEPSGVLNLVAVAENNIVGHVAFTKCTVELAGAQTPSGRTVALLAPLAVDPDHQRQGIGSALVKEGSRRLTGEGVAAVLTLGDPAYYRRLGFSPDHQIAAPYSLPAEWHTAWQCMVLAEPSPSALEGTLVIPPLWRRPELWLP